MKRSPSLRDLSSDHHQGLVQARRLVKAANGETPDAGSIAIEDVARDFLTFFSEETTRHFREEEEVLLPAFARYGEPSLPPVVRMLVEHVHMRRLVDDLQRQSNTGDPSLETMLAIGELLREHIRHEEDVVFPLIEGAMPQEALTELAGRLSAFTEQY